VTPLAWKDVKGHRVPVQWKVALPGKGLEVTTSPVNPDAWMDTQVSYWEGPVRLEGTHPGQGYVEMTGY
jgi:predicted secreted hydrolase